jgi:hypothetical protein
MTPAAPGVYALRHRATGKIYVGSSVHLRERKHKWWNHLNTKHPLLPRPILELASSRHDWEFVVLWTGSAASEELLSKEREALDAVRRRAPEKCLNSISPTRLDVHYITCQGRTQSLRAWAHETSVPRSTIAFRVAKGWPPDQALGFEAPPIRDYQATPALAAKVVVYDEGVALSQSQAAARLQCGAKTLSKRLQRYQQAGDQARVQLKDLIALSQKHRPKSLLQ